MDEMKARLDVHEERITAAEEEMLRIRVRLHDVEADRASLHLLVEQVRNLTTALDAFYVRAEDIAELAVQKVMNRNRDEKRTSRNYWLGWAGFALLVLGFVADKLTQFLHFAH